MLEHARVRAIAAAAIFSSASATTAFAQCPDGSPPPCGRQVTTKIDQYAVVLLPFAVRGPQELSYIGPAMPDLIQSGIDDIGTFKVVRAPASYRELRQPAVPIDVSSSVKELGARYVVAGSILAVGSELRVNAELFDVVRGERVAPFSARTDVENIALVADSIAVALFAARGERVRAPAKFASGGKVRNGDEVLVADFGGAEADSALARIAGEAVRTALQQSGTLRVLPSDRVGAALRRMKMNSNVRLSGAVAREVATREGVPIIAEGDVLHGRDGVALTVRLVSADSGSVLASRTARVEDESKLLDAADLVTQRLRSDFGESLRIIRTGPRLAEVTTSSLDALRLYTEADRAWTVDGNAERARALLNSAVLLDSTFAAAWRKLAVVGGPPNSAARAFQFRDRATQNERLFIEGTYYTVTGNWAQAEAAYSALAQREGVPRNNFALVLVLRRQYARAESVYRQVLSHNPESFSPYDGLIEVLLLEGRVAQADSVARLARSKFPGVAQLAIDAARIECTLERFNICARMLDSISRSSASVPTSLVFTDRYNLFVLRGQLSSAGQLVAARAARNPEEARRFASDALLRRATVDIAIRRHPQAALLRLDSLPQPIPGSPNNMLWAATLYAQAGRPQQARQVLQIWENTVPDSLRNDFQLADLRATLGEIKGAEGELAAAIEDLAAGDRVSDGPKGKEGIWLIAALARAYDRANQTDSAISMYEAYVKAPRISPHAWDAVWLAHSYERLAALYERRQTPDRAARYLDKLVNLWSEADPELQPRVEGARKRLQALRAGATL